MEWIFLIIASFGEIFGVMFISMYVRNKTIFHLLMIVVSMGFGFVFLSLAMKSIPLGTAYAIWTGLGAAGAVIMGIIFFKESAGWKRMLFLTCIIAGAVGLKVME
ncbi:DMT family transporter [Virgibacillus sp. W0181]|uniref:DMT family transporter n=1 Tax=Virgibacillus sp. W0181 TaxID=3391581 RepID=UPI003F46BABD